MADLKYYDVILKPIITEKSMNDMADKKYSFYVHPDATKPQIRDAIEKLFEGTKVQSVNTMNLMGKIKRQRTGGGIVEGRRKKRKKAIIQMTPDSKEIEIFKGM